MQTAQRADLRMRREAAAAMLRNCRLCPRACGVDRTRGESGYCGLGSGARCFREILHYGVELELAPAHAVYLTGCNMRCVFCTAWYWNATPAAAAPFDAPAMVQRVERRLGEGARTLLFVGGEPTVSLAAVLDLLARLPHVPRVALDSNMYASSGVMDLLAGVVDVYVADLKFGNDRCATELADTPRYCEVVTGNLLLAQEAGAVIVRHLLLPGHFECCLRPIIEWMRDSLAAPRLSLRGEYMPPERKAEGAPGRYVTADEHRRAADAARDMDIELVD
jgi:putative pyruvate formate lyase activating enzyme